MSEEPDTTPEEFREQPGDREPDPEAGEPAADAEAEPVEEPEAEAEPEGEAEPEPAAAEAGEGAEAEAEPEGEEEPAKPKKDWRDRQIIKARAAEKKEREEKAALAAENEELKRRLAGGEEGAVLTDAERARIRTEAVQEVERKAYFTKINDASESMFEAGQKAFPKTWEKRVADAAEVFSDEIRAKPEFLEAVTELDNPAAVYHELAGDPDLMESVLNMAPHKMGMELAKLSAKLAATPAPKPVSRAPAPIKPLDKPSMQERSLEDLANDPSPGAMAEFDRRMAVEEGKRVGRR